MDATTPGRLLADLHRGATSRNRHFDYFRDLPARRVLHSYRRLRSLFAELKRPGIQVEARWSTDRSRLVVYCHQPALRYSRRMDLAPWEVSFLLQEVDPVQILGIAPPSC